MSLFFQQLINGLSLGALYALIAVGYTVVYGIVQIINFAHGEIFMMGGFGALSTYIILGQHTGWWMLPIMLVGGMITSVVIALLMERFAYRPLRNAPRLAPLISAIGVSVFLQEFVRLFYGDIPGFPDAKQNVSFPSIQFFTGAPIQLGGGVLVQRPTIFTLVSLLVCTLVLWYFVHRTHTGRAMQATSQDPDTARLMGINVDRVIQVAFGLGAALAAIAGVAQGLAYNVVQFNMGFTAGLKAFTAAVLGGIGNINGAVVGGLVLGVAEAMATAYIPQPFGGSSWKDVWAFVILIIVLVFRPEGLLGSKAVDRA